MHTVWPNRFCCIDARSTGRFVEPVGPGSILCAPSEVLQAASFPCHPWLFAAFAMLLSSLAVAAAWGSGEAAWIAHLQGRQEEAVRMATESLVGDPGDATASMVLAQALHDLRRDDEAERFFARFDSEHPASGCGALGEGRLHRLQDRFATADSLLHRAADLFEQAASVRGTILVGGLLAELYEKQGDLDRAESLLEETLPAVERIGWSTALAWIHLRFGSVLVSTRRHDEAVLHLEEALRGADERKASRWVGDAHMLLSVVARWAMDLEKSLSHRRSALAAYRAAGFLAGEARAHHFISGIYLRRGNLAGAKRELMEGLALAKEADSRTEQAGCLGGLAVVDMLVGNEEAAIRGFRKALAVAGESRGTGWTAGMESNLGLVYLNLDRYAEAITRFEQALGIVRQGENRRYEATVLSNIGRCLCAMGREEDGIDRLEEAARLGSEWNTPLTVAHALLDIGSCHYRRGDLAAADSVFAKATEAIRRTDYYEIQASVLMGRSRVARAQGLLEEALRLQEGAIAIVEGVRARSRAGSDLQTQFFGYVNPIYQDAVDLLWEMNRKWPDGRYGRTAFELAQQAKARSLLDLLAEAEVKLRYRADPVYLDREREICARIAEQLDSSTGDTANDSQADAEIDRLEGDLERLEAELREADPRYAEIQYPRPLDVAAVQRRTLAEGELLLEYFLCDSASYLWAVTKDRFRFLRLPPRGIIEAKVKALLPMLSNYNLLGNDASYFIQPAQELSRILIGSILEELEETETVIVSPSGILNYLPFEVLLTEPDLTSGTDFTTLPYWVRKADLIYTPSISVYARLQDAKANNAGAKPLLLFGDPTLPERSASLFGLEGLGANGAAVPFAAEEMMALRELLGAGETEMITGNAATPAGLAQVDDRGPYRWIHIAAHGFFNERRPRYSGLLLAASPDHESDGFLPVGEVFGLELPCDQIVLSSCSSALGEKTTGEGLVGLTRAFLHAGARSVVATLWDVSGASTAEFMISFYRHLLDTETTSRSHALAEAKRHFARGEVEAVEGLAGSGAHPYFWAAFEMIGVPR